ncbi:hypothetical protein TNCV_171591 [Trichonephila clavipes]|nr:hypothetical protein TNCV_171591 [Trichonephila clavipes]
MRLARRRLNIATLEAHLFQARQVLSGQKYPLSDGNKSWYSRIANFGINLSKDILGHISIDFELPYWTQELSTGIWSSSDKFC